MKVDLDENDFLSQLNEIVNIAIGNETAVDVGFGERNTLPEHLAYLQMNPMSQVALAAATKKVNAFVRKVLELKERIRVLNVKYQLKNKC
jgi:hypothetical protein